MQPNRYLVGKARMFFQKQQFEGHSRGQGQYIISPHSQHPTNEVPGHTGPQHTCSVNEFQTTAGMGNLFQTTKTWSNLTSSQMTFVYETSSLGSLRASPGLFPTPPSTYDILGTAFNQPQTRPRHQPQLYVP